MRLIKKYLSASFVTSTLLSAGFFLLFSSCTPSVTEIPEANPTVTSIARQATTTSPCTSFSAVPTPGPDTPSLFPPITESDHTRGPENAIVTIMVYGDLQDGTSGLFAEVVNRLLVEY